MPNKFDQRKLINQVIQDKDAELMPHELNELLEKELSKPAEEVDMQLVNELLDLLGAENPTAAEKEACWRNIQMNKPAKKHNWKSVLRRASAAVAAIAVLFFVSFESAKAFRWTFLLKLLTPVAETFGIYSTSTFNSDDPVNDNTAMLNEDTEYEQVTYDSVESMPSELNGYKIVPDWVPEKFAFVVGNTYEDPDMSLGSLYYRYNSDSLSVNTYIYHNDDAVVGFTYERTLSEPHAEEVNGLLVNYYHNSDGKDLSSASWISGDAHYHVEGNISEEDLRKMVSSMIE